MVLLLLAHNFCLLRPNILLYNWVRTRVSIGYSAPEPSPGLRVLHQNQQHPTEWSGSASEPPAAAVPELSLQVSLLSRSHSSFFQVEADWSEGDQWKSSRGLHPPSGPSGSVLLCNCGADLQQHQNPPEPQNRVRMSAAEAGELGSLEFSPAEEQDFPQVLPPIFS